MAKSEQTIYVNMNTGDGASATQDLEKELLVLRLADPQKGLQVLSERGVPLVSQEQINRL